MGKRTIGLVWSSLVVLCVGACSTGPVAPGGVAIDDLAGVWLAVVEHSGTTARFGLEMERNEDGGLSAYLSLPDMEVFRVDAGPVQVRGNDIVVASMVLTYDAKQDELRGTMPESMVPVHTIPLVLQRAPRLEAPAPSPPPAPRAEPIWTHETGGPVWAGVAVGEDTIFVGSDDGRVYALEAATGRERWQFTTQGGIRAAPVVTGASLLVHSDDGHLYRLDARTGALEWDVALEAAPTARLSFGDAGFRYDHYASSPAVAGATVFIGHSSRVHALDLETGRTRWVFEAGDLVTSNPAVREGRVFFGSFDGRVHAVSSATGASIWSHDTGAAVPTSPAPYGDLIIVGSRSYDLLALRAADGVVVWNFYNWFSWVDSSATVRDGVAYIGSSDAQFLRALDAASGREIWAYDTGGWAWGTPAVSGEMVFIGSVGTSDYFMKHEGAFHAVDRKTGQGRWRFAPGDSGDVTVWGFGSSPAILGGRVFVGGLDGRVHAFSLTPPAPTASEPPH